MKIAISKILPSPFNPKYEMDKEELVILKNKIEKFGFQGSIIVCKDFREQNNKYICLDGNSRLKIIRELEYKTIDCFINNKVTNINELKQFVSAYDHTRKKYKNIEIFKLYKTDSFFKDIQKYISINFRQWENVEGIGKKIDIKLDNIVKEQYILTLPRYVIKNLKLIIGKLAVNDRGYDIMKRLGIVTDDVLMSYFMDILYKEKSIQKMKKNCKTGIKQ